ncbi:Rhomboid domain-containing protein [Mycena indigotica]|uniref:Rhomboid domain-containing protein n=1 Tax=Mycena indigotica TaxID=2126181 RepID=A0A8H6T2S4_9AGAR|nr:Rhomboid domain-containing protein [Mycena indigotica]KAF7309810.1 Rhomboid domain-containing protein [Mycena indigotica]
MLFLHTTLPRLRNGYRSLNIALPRWPLAKRIANPSLPSEATLAQKVGRPSIQKQTIFVLSGTLLAFTYASALTTVETEEAVEKMTRGRSRTWPHTITSIDMRNAADFALAQELREGLKKVGSATESLPVATRNRIMRLWATVAQSYLNVSDGKRLCWKLCLLNIGVWLAFKSRRLRPFMMHGFAHDPLSGKSYTMLTSILSSPVLPLLGLNLLFLDGFGSSAAFHLTQRQERIPDSQLEATSRYHFLAFFVSAGLFAALASHIVHVKVLYPRLISRLSASSPATSKPDTWASALRNMPPPTSRFRSFFRLPPPPSPAPPRLAPRFAGTGALYALMTITALGFPNAEISLFYPPNYSVPIQWGACGLLLLDVFGIWRGWKLLDHFAHLGGAAFGGLYYLYGPGAWNWIRAAMADEPEEEER